MATQWRLFIAVVATFAFVAAACGDSDTPVTAGADPDAAEATTVEGSDDADDDVEEESATTEAPTTTEAAMVDPIELPDGPLDVDTGYTTDMLGTPLSFVADREWVLAVAEPGVVILEDPGKTTDTSEAVLVLRLNGLADATEASAGPAGASLSGDPNDVEAWIEALGDVVVSNESTVDLHGASAQRLDMVVNEDVDGLPGGCGPTPEDTCFMALSSGSAAVPFAIVRTSEAYRFWIIDQGDLDPIMVFAIAAEGNEAWLDDVDGFVGTFMTGDPAPHPIAPPPEDAPWEAGFPGPVPAGSVMIPAAGGVTFDMTEERSIFQDMLFASIEANGETEGDFPPAMTLARAEEGFNPEIDDEPAPLEGVADAVERLEAISTLTETDETIEVFGVTLQGYDFVDAQPVPVFTSAPAGQSSNVLFGPSPVGRYYMGEAGGGAVYIVGYDAPSLEELPAAVAVFDEILPTLKLAE